MTSNMIFEESENLINTAYGTPAKVNEKIIKLMKQKKALLPILSKPQSRAKSKGRI